MIVTPWADLHLHHGAFNYVPDANIILCSGDSGEGDVAVDMFKRLCLDHGKRIVMVLGNHDYYSSHGFENLNLVQIIDKWHEFSHQIGDNFNFLDNSSCEIDGQRFVGTTLWSHIPPDLERLAAHKLKDFEYIKINNGVLRPYHYNLLHREAVSFLEKELRAGDVALVHHAPSNFGAGKLYKSDPLSCCYYSNISGMLMDKALKALFYGHMHKTAHYMMGDLPIHSNPRGYAGQSGYNKEFDPNLQIKL